jgi:CheY-like chemotaxis protein
MDYVDQDIALYDAADSDMTLSPLIRQIPTNTRTVRQAVVAVVENGIRISQEFWAICEFLEIAVVRVSADCDLDAVLTKHSPMAVVCELDGEGQDGCHVMKRVASHDPSLPILLVTDDDPILIAAADAVQEIWQLTEVSQFRSLPGIAGLVDFLVQAGRKGRCLRLMPARG